MPNHSLKIVSQSKPPQCIRYKEKSGKSKTVLYKRKLTEVLSSSPKNKNSGVTYSFGKFIGVFLGSSFLAFVFGYCFLPVQCCQILRSLKNHCGELEKLFLAKAVLDYESQNRDELAFSNFSNLWYTIFFGLTF